MPVIPGQSTPLGSACDPAIPHKHWFFRAAELLLKGQQPDKVGTYLRGMDTASQLKQLAAWEQENWLELERWARHFRLSCSRSPIPFSYPGTLGTEESPPWAEFSSRSLRSARVLRGAGTSSTVIAAKVNGTTVVSLTCSGTDLDSGRIAISIELEPDDVLTVEATTLGAAEDVTVLFT